MSRLAAAVLVFAGLTQTAFAFDKCAASLALGDELGPLMSEQAVRRSPVKYHELARGIRVLTHAPGETVMPFATAQQGTRFVVMSPAFAKLACQLALAQYLAFETDDTGMEQAARTAGRCLDQGGSQRKCLLAFGDEVARRYQGAWNALPEGHRSVAHGLYFAALYQIGMHEYAHHFLDHSARIRAKTLTRIDAEFEADLFAMTNGVQGAEPPSAMFYFFKGLSRVEEHTKQRPPPDYESGTCRAINVNNITAFFGVLPMLLVDAAYGGGFAVQRNSPADVRAEGKRMLGGAPPQLTDDSCDRITAVALGTAFAEMKQMYQRMDRDLEFLFDKSKPGDAARANRLLRDLSTMAATFQYMDGIAAKGVAALLRGWGIKGRKLTPLMAEVDRMLATSGASDDFLAEDMGRILQAQGLALLQERVDVPAATRLERANALLQRAVFYNPAQTEAWMNLAFVALERGDCAAAARYGERSLQTLTAQEPREGTEFFVKTMKEAAGNRERCRAMGEQFAPYPGL